MEEQLNVAIDPLKKMALENFVWKDLGGEEFFRALPR